MALENHQVARRAVLGRRAAAAGGEALSYGLDVQPDLLRRARGHRRETRRVLHRDHLHVVGHQAAFVHGHEGLARDGRDQMRVLLVGQAKPAPGGRRGGRAILPSLVPVRLPLLLALRHRHGDVPAEKRAVRELQRLRRRLRRLERDVAKPAAPPEVVPPEPQVHQSAALAEKLADRALVRAEVQVANVHRLVHVTAQGTPVHRSGGF
mmetsp:Transcript_1147/g.4842  ORF Transcript_1147/g.4842 Transcript_1147/m.4842 type:complete len:208 (-) Transcript_1147:1039-1662(-)